MPVGLLCVTTYESSCGPYSTESIAEPTWDQIELALRNLDRDLCPFIWLYRTSAVDQENDLPDFEVLGGQGSYFVAYRDGETELKFHDPSRGDKDIDVWISDQGASFPAKDVCPDLNAVIAAAREFHVSGGATKNFQWADYDA